MQKDKRREAMNAVFERQRRARVAEKWVRRILLRDGPSTMNHLQVEIRKVRSDIRPFEIREASRSLERVDRHYHNSHLGLGLSPLDRRET